MSSIIPLKAINYVWGGDTRDKFDHVYLNIIYDIAKRLYLLYCNQRRNYNRKSSLGVGDKRPVALPNIGLNCYVNSSFQSIVACPRFIWEMKELEKKFPGSKTLLVFNKILASLNDDCGDDVELSNNTILRNWNKTGEQDTFEILSYVLFQVFNELRKIHEAGMSLERIPRDNWFKVPLPMKLLLEFRLRCRGCGHESQPTNQSDLALHLTVPPRLLLERHSLTIEQLIENYFVPERIGDFPCRGSGCRDPNVTKTIVLLRPAPTTICLHIQRSFWNSGKSMTEKINEKVDFRETLLLKEDYFRADRDTPNGPISSALACLPELGQWFQTSCGHENDTGPLSNTSEPINGMVEITDMAVQSIGIEKCASELHTDSSVIVSSPIETDNIDQCLSIDNSPIPLLNGWPHGTERPDIGDVGGQDSSVSVSTGTEQSRCQPLGTNQAEHAIAPPSVGNSTATEGEASDCSIIDYSLLRADCLINGDVIHDSGQIDGEEYCLRSVIVHFGSAESGHYICYRKCGPKWFCTNDNFVTEVSFREVQHCQAYILMYEKPIGSNPPISPDVAHTLY